MSDEAERLRCRGEALALRERDLRHALHARVTRPAVPPAALAIALVSGVALAHGRPRAADDMARSAAGWRCVRRITHGIELYGACRSLLALLRQARSASAPDAGPPVAHGER